MFPFELSPPLILTIVLVAIFIVGIAISATRFSNRRSKDMSAIASSLGLQHSPDNTLPRGLTLQATLFRNHTKLCNIYHGVLNRVEVVFLDFHGREDNAPWSRTIVAIRTGNQVSTPINFECRQIGSWYFIYSPIGFPRTEKTIEADRIEQIIRAMAR